MRWKWGHHTCCGIDFTQTFDAILHNETVHCGVATVVCKVVKTVAATWNGDGWIRKNSYFYNDDRSYMKFLVGKEKRILELGCGTGQLLNILNPSYGLGVDISANMVSIAKQNYPNLEFLQGDLEDESLYLSSLIHNL